MFFDFGFLLRNRSVAVAWSSVCASLLADVLAKGKRSAPDTYWESASDNLCLLLAPRVKAGAASLKRLARLSSVRLVDKSLVAPCKKTEGCSRMNGQDAGPSQRSSGMRRGDRGG